MCANQQLAMPSVNQKFKDRLFRLIFNNPESLLNLYNAINGTTYTNPKDLIINTLEDVIYLSMKNDLSFIIYNELNLFEHQSTLNKNMPLRGLLYFAELLKTYIAENDLDIYSSPQLSLPFPSFIVFYNGLAPYPERGEMLLSSSYEVANVEEKIPALECRALILNINIGQNESIMKQCRELWGYSYFIGRIRYYQRKRCSLGEAVDQAIEDSIQADALADYLQMHRQEVKTLILKEYDEQKHIRNEKEISWREGREEGLAEGKAEGLAEGKAEGLAEGDTRRLFHSICLKCRKNKDLPSIADEVEEDILFIQPFYNFALAFAPEFDESIVCNAWFNRNSQPTE